MKTSCFISLLVVLVFCACQKTEEHPPVFASRFAEIDTLMSQQPDSALSLLLAMADTLGYDALPAMHQHEFQILLAEALYKNDYLQANDSAVQAASLYFDSLAAAHPHDSELRYQQARALYYKAVGLQEKDQPVEACGDFLTALQLMEQTENLSPAQNHFAALTCRRLVNLYFSYDAFDIAIECAKHSNDYYEKENNPKGIVISYNLMGKCFACKQMVDSAMWYYNLADSLAQIAYPDGKHPLFWVLLRNKIQIAIPNDKAYALELIEKSADMAQTEEEVDDYHILKGEYLYSMQQYDSALYYYEKAETSSFYYTLHISDRLLDIAKQMGDTARMTRYALAYGENSKKEMDNNPQKPLMVSLYEQHQRQKAQQEKTIQGEWVIAIVIILVVAGLYIGRLMKKKKDKEQEANKVKQQLSQSQNETELLKLHHQQETENLQQGLRLSESEKEQMKLHHQQETEDLQQRLRQSENEKEQMKLHHQQETEDLQQGLRQSESEKEQMKLSHQQKTEDLQQRLRQSESEKEQMKLHHQQESDYYKGQLLHSQNENELLQIRLQQQDLQHLFETPICQSIFDTMRSNDIKSNIRYPELKLSPKQQEALFNAVDGMFPEFHENLMNVSQFMTDADRIFCYLYLLNLNEAQIAALVGCSYQTAWRHSEKYCKIFAVKTTISKALRAMLK